MSVMSLIFAFFVAFVAAFVLTPLVGRLAIRHGVLDRPDGGRKQHSRPIPLWGGLALLAALVLGVTAAAAVGAVPGTHIKFKFLVGLAAAVGLLTAGGMLDGKFNLRPGRQFVWPVLAALAVIASGIGVTYVTNPLGGLVYLNELSVTVLWWDGLPYKLTVLADLFTLVWLLGMTYTTKLLDGLDGLVVGVTGIGALVLAAVSLMREVAQPDTAVLAMILAGACFGFLIFNANPARIFLGEGGSTLCGFALGVLAIISGGKIATALLVLGLPILDAALVIIRRVVIERRPFSVGDRSHLHFRLIDAGLSIRETVLIYYLTAALFGITTLVLRGWQKILALALLAALTASLAWLALRLGRRRQVTE